MAYFLPGGSPAYSTFRANYGLGQTAMSDIRARTYPYNMTAMSSFRNQGVYRYTINTNSNASGRVRLLYPYDSGLVFSTTTPWFISGSYPYITIQATATYPWRFSSWRTDGYNTTFLSSNNPTNIAWNATGNINVTATWY